MTAFDVRILGSGIVSRAMALTLARQGLRVALQAKPPAEASERRPDVRAYALNPASVTLLEGLRAWQALPEDARSAVLDMRVHGDAHGAAIEFSAWQQAVPALAWIVDAAALEAVLESAASFAPLVTLQPEPGNAPLTLIAEGKASVERERRGVGFERHAYGHRAIAARLVSDRPHGGTALQWFRSPDILALLPFDRPQPQHAYGLVWSLPEAQAQQWLAAPVAEFEAELNQATAGAAGTLKLASERMSWPLAIGQAEAVTGPGWALLGDAAHQVHPLAGQGLNLGLADVAALAQVLAERESWRGLGDAALLRRYARRRGPAQWAMARATDGLWNLFTPDHPGLRELRNRGLSLVNQLAPVKRWLASHALDV
ncbi:FAD-dependent monooxygenase [Ideonella azotifigens]|uniref:UbiH/UbiF family hydroxylase n=1 Tax=Ideonella azotifigens TaxID=513160 RepID=A0ABP3V9Q9_9BURK|nr:FAD-dependent monooxygenase [Ideonella azotifigens]MCD2341548.1 FAD-dependent monooxygenase [Ideonella azotifigens]